MHRVIEFRKGVGMWNPTHSFVLHVGFVTRIIVTFGSGMHKGTRKCRLCRHKTGDKSDTPLNVLSFDTAVRSKIDAIAGKCPIALDRQMDQALPLMLYRPSSMTTANKLKQRDQR